MLEEKEMEMIKKEVKENVEILFKRIYNIKKIRRKRKLNEWINRNLN